MRVINGKTMNGTVNRYRQSIDRQLRAEEGRCASGGRAAPGRGIRNTLGNMDKAQMIRSTSAKRPNRKPFGRASDMWSRTSSHWRNSRGGCSKAMPAKSRERIVRPLAVLLAGALLFLATVPVGLLAIAEGLVAAGVPRAAAYGLVAAGEPGRRGRNGDVGLAPASRAAARVCPLAGGIDLQPVLDQGHCKRTGCQAGDSSDRWAKAARLRGRLTVARVPRVACRQDGYSSAAAVSSHPSSRRP